MNWRAGPIGMRFDREYPDEVNGITHVSAIRREDLAREMKDMEEKW